VSLAYLPVDRIANEILPDNVQLLYNFAENQMASKSLEPRRPELYRRIVALLEESQNRDRKSLVIKSEVQENLGDLQGAIKTQQLLVNNFRNIVGFKYRLTNLIFKRCEEIMERPEASQNWREELEERIDQAKEALDNLKRKDKNKEYQAEIRKALLRHKQITEKARQAGLNK